MKKPKEITVYYPLKKKKIPLKFDKKLIKAMKKMGYKWWASGTDTETFIRDLCFDLKK